MTLRPPFFFLLCDDGEYALFKVYAGSWEPGNFACKGPNGNQMGPKGPCRVVSEENTTDFLMDA